MNPSLLSLLAFPFIGFAQEDDEEIFELSPFSVDESGTMGYYASETLSGTQLRSSVRDLANPITIFTAELLSDMGAVQYEEALEFMPSTRAFVGDVSDIDSNTGRTGTPYNVRGFRVTTLTQNFFATRIKVDSFNMERLTQSRGPNSLLFGLGSVGGALDATNKLGRFDGNTYEVAFRVDDFGSYRGTFDVNHILVEDKLAIRVAGLYENRETNRDLQYRTRESGYVNFTYRPFEKTTIHANIEWGGWDELNPRSYLTKDNISGWTSSTLSPLEKANTTDLDLILAGGSARSAARNAIQRVTESLSTRNRLTLIQNDPSMGVTNFVWKSQSSRPWVNDNVQSTAAIKDSTLVPGVEYPITTIPSGPSDHVNWDYLKYAATLQQQIFDKTFLEVAYAYEKSDSEDWRPVRRQNFEINLDNNYYLPTQRAADNPNTSQPLNPYFGLPYIESNSWLFLNENEDHQWRVTLNQQIDMSSIEPFSGFDLGNLSLVGSWYNRDEYRYTLRQDEMNLAPQVRFDNGRNEPGNNPNRRIYRRYYLTGSNPPHWPEANSPGRGFETVVQAENPANPLIEPAVVSGFVNRLAPIVTNRDTDSLSFIGQWQMFQDRLILTGGTREDTITNTPMTFVRSPIHNNWEGRESGTFRDPIKGDPIRNHNYGAVVRVHKNFDIFYNASTNTVSAGSTNYDIFNNPLPDQEGDGEDMGIRAFLLDNRLIFKLGYFENTLLNKTQNPLRDGSLGISFARENGMADRFLDGMAQHGHESYIVGSPIWEEYAGNALWSDVVNESTEGYELEMTINPTDNWRIMLNVSKNDALLSETFILTTPWYDQFVAPAKADWQAGTLDLENEFLYDLPDVSTADTIREIDRKFAFHRAQVGGQTIRTNTWLANLVTSYSFDRESALKGFRIGGTVRYRDSPVVGYQEIDGEFRSDLPFKGNDVLNTDVFVSYRANSSLFGDGNWELTFRVRNLTDQGPYYPNTAVDNGFGDPFYLQYIHMLPRSYELSGRYRF